MRIGGTPVLPVLRCTLLRLLFHAIGSPAELLRIDDYVRAEMRAALVAPTREKPRFGYRRLWALLTRRGWKVNNKRIYRLYQQEWRMVRWSKGR